MVLAGPHPAAVNVAYLAGVLKPKFKYASIIGSYGWGGKLFDKITECLVPIKPEILEPVLVKGKAKLDDFIKLDNMTDLVSCPFLPVGHGVAIKALLEDDLEVIDGKVIDHIGLLK